MKMAGPEGGGRMKSCFEASRRLRLSGEKGWGIGPHGRKEDH
jgi:hypothetical protein